MVQLSRRFSLKLVSKCGPTTLARHAGQVWAIPFSLATTWGITIVFFSSRYLDVSVPGVDFLLSQDNTPSVCWVVPFGNLRILRLCAAPRSLSQLTTSFVVSQSQGIHHTPLSALKELLPLLVIYNLKISPNMSKSYRMCERTDLQLCESIPRHSKADVMITNHQAFRLHHKLIKELLKIQFENSHNRKFANCICGGYRSRTDDP